VEAVTGPSFTGDTVRMRDFERMGLMLCIIKFLNDKIIGGVLRQPTHKTNNLMLNNVGIKYVNRLINRVTQCIKILTLFSV
jgi:hypothetical protein